MKNVSHFACFIIILLVLLFEMIIMFLLLLKYRTNKSIESKLFLKTEIENFIFKLGETMI